MGAQVPRRHGQNSPLVQLGYLAAVGSPPRAKEPCSDTLGTEYEDRAIGH